jgi:NADP-dependent 3-hydroxy acid dehydrogenase YdfG
MLLKGKIALITGATAGIGESCTKYFAREGCNLIITGRRNDRLENLKNELEKSYGINCYFKKLDVRNFKEVEELIDSLPPEFKDIDILINNAGKALGLDNIQEGNIDDWDEMIDTNIKGILYTTRLIAPKMIEKNSGFIINISSIAGRAAYPKGNVYCATKSATRTLSEAMAIDFNGTGVRVCNIDPGLTETEFSLVRFKGDSERAKQTYQNIKALSGDDIAEIILFVVTRPQHVMIQDIMVTPTDQANAFVITRK